MKGDRKTAIRSDDSQELTTINRRGCLKLGAIGAVGNFQQFSEWLLGEQSARSGIGHGFGGLPALDERIIPYFQESDLAPAKRINTERGIHSRFGGADTYEVSVDGDYLFADIVRESASKTAAAVVVGGGRILDAQYLGAGTTRLAASATSLDGVVVQVFNLDAGAGTYYLDVSEPEQAPYDEQWNLPGKIEAEDYDTGGAGVAYSDTTDQNMGGYRDGAVDIEATSDDGGGYNIAWTDAGEWTEYTVGSDAGTYDIDLRVASNRGEGKIRVSLDGTALGTVDIPQTGGWQNWQTVTVPDIELDETDGSVLRIEAVEGGYNLNWIEFNQAGSIESPPEQSPYGSSAWEIPGMIQVEDYDTGGAGVAYSDTTDQNMGGYRDGAVDIEATSDDGGGHNIAWTDTGEWTEYTVDTITGTYEARLRVASNRGNGRIRLLLDGEVVGTVDIPKTGGWQNWQTVTIPELSFDAGDGRVLRVEALEGGYNLNWIEFVDSAAESGDPISTPDDWSYSAQGYGEGTYGGVEA
ncbi:carbohydrate-binding domain-containing protein [Halorubrum sp. T3]|uniref:carbohydrate-binding domain-containing protein n=1 Tax=Halorubrum sp. T3 TaxID=1194088 RepID=UPI00178C79D5|nr:carbohydrate-binding domain-containing protein [Halorubrum sp. T3]